MSLIKPEDLKIANRYASLPETFYTKLPPTPLKQPRLLHANDEAAQLLGLTAQTLAQPEWVQVLAGSAPLPGGSSLAAVYSGHQFGVWAGQLGDGRAHLLGEIVGPHGNWEVQLKGSGLTPYSRMGDGKAVIRSSVREYLASEAMHGLGIPTTRALSLVVADDPVYRETVERAAVVARLAPSFIRFGTFEHWARQPEALRRLFDFTVDNYFPALRQEQNGPYSGPQALTQRFLHEVVERSARLVAGWQTVGFCHGVMNTDNMSILGLTLDYGPYGFMDAFRIDHICNHTDRQGRYAWHAQPSVMHWNLCRLAESLLPLGVDVEQAKTVLSHFEAAFLQEFQGRLQAKMGLGQWREGDSQLVDDWWRLLHTQQADFTLCFRRLAQVPASDTEFLALFADDAPAREWLLRYRERVGEQAWADPQRLAGMNAANPLYVLRNYLAEQAIRGAERDDPTEIDVLMRLLRTPCTEQTGAQAYAQAAPDWARELSVSCSS
ncbi:YdiU family protein [Pusillimonas sp. CC-YST705]|uniref:Protein nucleotidyltransferase YdiU n=1 Tax=Mesopusillimonas faecipullorum TaxID=2755040 RepID=A0ABS8CAD9_9BURK|nr:YdiU family protein [Mesopusillimonas faecipullorum]MCB5362995.1 YdiU family protein [Mesopusillimonas faecipullorum]